MRAHCCLGAAAIPRVEHCCTTRRSLCSTNRTKLATHPSRVARAPAAATKTASGGGVPCQRPRASESDDLARGARHTVHSNRLAKQISPHQGSVGNRPVEYIETDGRQTWDDLALHAPPWAVQVVLYCSDGSPHILDVGICFARRFAWTECTPVGLLHEYMRQIARKYVIYKRVSTARLSPQHSGFALLMRVRAMTAKVRTGVLTALSAEC